MSPLTLAVIGGVAAAGVLLLTRKAGAATIVAPPPSTPPAPAPAVVTPISYGETTRVPLAVPSGWRRVGNSEVTSELRSAASSLRSSTGFTSLPYGTLRPFTGSDGKQYATWVEQHYHEPGGAVKPWGYHHGVTLLVKSGGSIAGWP